VPPGTCRPVVPNPTLVPILGQWKWLGARPGSSVARTLLQQLVDIASLLRPPLHAIPEPLAVQLRLDGELGAMVGTGQLGDAAAGLEGRGQLVGLAVVPAYARACGKGALAPRLGLAGGRERVQQALPGHHGQGELAAVGRDESCVEAAVGDLEDIAAIALPPFHPLPDQRLRRLPRLIAALVALRHCLASRRSPATPPRPFHRRQNMSRT